jgi:hypothetical protein
VSAPAETLGTAFTYQGRLTDGGSPANGEYDFRFMLYDAASSGAQVGSAVMREDVTVTDGLFTVQLDFGSGAFTGEARYLEIGVRPGDSTGAYTDLSPRQPLTPAPYALVLPGLWTQQNGTSPNLIGGYSGNSVGFGVVGATIGGGGNSGLLNQVTGDYATIGGGYGNEASGYAATVGGGYLNAATAPTATIGGGEYISVTGEAATVAGGSWITATGDYAAVGGGRSNTASGSRATVGGGRGNTASATGATVGGGSGNEASGDSATVGGGEYNTADGDFVTVGGGESNNASEHGATIGGGVSNTASDQYATVPGGRDNTAGGAYSFAAGQRAKANHDGTFVWADSSDFDFGSTVANSFKARATGGVRFVVGIDDSGNTTWSCLVNDGTSWSCSSDRNLKENLQPVDGGEVLRRLQEVPIYTWNGKGQDPAAPHMGPMAQDFAAAFGLGEDDTHIATIDLDGVALAAIQELYAQNVSLQAKSVALEAEVSSFKEENADLEARVAALEAALANGAALPQAWQANLLPWAGALLAGVSVAWAFRRRDGLGSFNGGGR